MQQPRMGAVLGVLGVLAEMFGAALGAHAYEWYTWPGNGHSYAVIETPGTWDEQVAVAEAEGAYLVTITSFEENTFLALTFGANWETFWTGGVRDGAGLWQWINGETMDFTNWDWEPSLRPDRNYVAFQSGVGTWFNAPGSWTYPAIMEKDEGLGPRDKNPPEIVLNPAYPSLLWPPGRHPVSVTFTGVARDAETRVARAWLVVVDSYGLYGGVYELTDRLDAYGCFTLTLLLEPWSHPRDSEGRVYTATLYAEDKAGNAAAPRSVWVTTLSPRDRAHGR